VSNSNNNINNIIIYKLAWILHFLRHPPAVPEESMENRMKKLASLLLAAAFVGPIFAQAPAPATPAPATTPAPAKKVIKKKKPAAPAEAAPADATAAPEAAAPAKKVVKKKVVKKKAPAAAETPAQP